MVTVAPTIISPQVTPQVIVKEDYLFNEIELPTVNVGNSISVDFELVDIYGITQNFLFILFKQIDIVAPSLSPTDTVRVRLYTRATKREPRDLIIEFTGNSQVSGMWVSSLSNQNVEYPDLDRSGKVHMKVENLSGNSSSSSFIVRFYAIKRG